MAGIGGAQRRLVVLAGTRAWAQEWLASRMPAGPGDDGSGVLWVADDAPPSWPSVPASRVTQVLGSESRLLVFNGHDGLHPDALAAACGTLRGGGDCVLLMPPLDDWPHFADPDKQRFAAYPHVVDALPGRFLARLHAQWCAAGAVVQVVTPEATQPTKLRVAPAAPVAIEPTAAQWDAIAAVERVARGHARRPLVLTADRGRGKSTVLGIAVARLLQGGVRNISVIAPHRAASATLWRHAALTAGMAPSTDDALCIGGGTLRRYQPADWPHDDAADLVIVDEAAAIAVATLEQVLARANRIVFASTVHGYEGSGRGFALRFQRALSRAMPQWHGLQLDTPVRWTDGDPLEACIHRALLLDVDIDLDDAGNDADVECSLCDVERLAHDEPLLRQVFGLLVSAHYQTRPSDLRQLLDNPDVRVWLAQADGRVVGVLMAVCEGGIDDGMAARILRAERRPRGHLMSQSLAVHAGFGECLRLRLLRVQRIAVHPSRRCEGIGRELVRHAFHWAGGEGIDLLGCAYGVERELLAFWRACGLSPVRIGFRVDPASAAHSLFMLMGVGDAGVNLTQRAHRRFLDDLPWSLGASLRDLDSALAVELLRGRDCADVTLDAAQYAELRRLAQGARQPDTADALLWRALVALVAAGADAATAAPLCAWRLQHHDPAAVCACYGIAGRAALEQRLRALIETLRRSG